MSTQIRLTDLELKARGLDKDLRLVAEALNRLIRKVERLEQRTLACEKRKDKADG